MQNKNDDRLSIVNLCDNFVADTTLLIWKRMKKTIGRLSPRASEKKRTDSKKFGGGGGAKTEDDILLSGMTKHLMTRFTMVIHNVGSTWVLTNCH